MSWTHREHRICGSLKLRRVASSVPTGKVHRSQHLVGAAEDPDPLHHLEPHLARGSRMLPLLLVADIPG